MNSVKIASGEESVKTTVTELTSQTGGSKKETKKQPVQVRRQLSESSDSQFNNEGKKCVIM